MYHHIKLEGRVHASVKAKIINSLKGGEYNFVYTIREDRDVLEFIVNKAAIKEGMIDIEKILIDQTIDNINIRHKKTILKYVGSFADSYGK